MPDQFESSSFIPKGGAQYDGPDARSRGGGRGLLFIISLVLLGIAALAAGGVFFYTQYLESDLADKQEQLAQAQASAESGVVSEFSQLETRINTAKELLSNHTVVTPVLDVVESVTLAGIQLTNVTISSASRSGGGGSGEAAQEEAPPGDVVVSMTGLARDYAAVALQSEALVENETVIEPSLGDFTVNEQGDVEFSVEFFLDAEYMSYESTI